jgi:two-component system, NtrC family, sensor kinase
VLETGEPVSHSAVSSGTNAAPARWQVSYYPVRVAGELVGVGFVVGEITESTAAEAFRAAVMDHMTEGLCTTDNEGRVNSVNRAATEMLGWSETELLGRSLHDLVHNVPDGNGHSAQGCPLALYGAGGEQAGEREDRYVRKDGSVLEVAHSVFPLHVGAPVAGVVVVFRDITELKERERRQVEGSHDQKLEALGRLSAGLAHEINTPIQFVGDNTRFLAEAYQTMLELLLVYRECMGLDSGGQLPWEERKQRAQEAEEKADIEYLAEEVPGAVQQSLEGIDRVASLVRAMKAFSYKDTKEHSYADLNEGIRTTVIVARNEVKYVADVVLDLGELPDVLCNLGDLNQVFLNLLVNAADAMPEGGKRGEIKITTRVDGPMVVLSFADDGTGIPEEIRKTIFDPFFTTKEVGKGTGQGLALARAVCEKHGGTIEVNSEIGVGTEFVLSLPISGKRGGPA